jgi:hypothetical protein
LRALPHTAFATTRRWFLSVAAKAFHKTYRPSANRIAVRAKKALIIAVRIRQLALPRL